MDEKLVREQLMKMAQTVSNNFCWKLTYFFIRKGIRPDDEALHTYLAEISDYYKTMKEVFVRMTRQGMPLDDPAMPDWDMILRVLLVSVTKGKSANELRSMMRKIQDVIGHRFGMSYYISNDSCECLNSLSARCRHSAFCSEEG